MKKIFTIAILFLLVVVASIAQVVPQQTTPISDHVLAMQYLNEGKSQQKISTILLITGGTLILTGLIVSVAGMSSGFDFAHPDKGGSAIDAGSVLVISGACIMATGIPFAFASKHNKKNAELLISNEKVRPSTSFLTRKMYSIELVIHL